jgi:hypothetical protein
VPPEKRAELVKAAALELAAEIAKMKAAQAARRRRRRYKARREEKVNLQFIYLFSTTSLFAHLQA